MNENPFSSADSDDFDLDFSALLNSSNLAEFIFSRDKKSSAEQGEKYVLFYLDEKLYAVQSRQVVEVIGELSVTPLPSALVPDWLAGIANLRGDIIAAVDLRRLWKKTTVTAPVSKNKFFVLQSKRENYKIAFIVDKFAEMITLTSGDVEFSAADFESSFPTFFGRASHKSQTVFLLDPETLFSSLSTADY